MESCRHEAIRGEISALLREYHPGEEALANLRGAGFSAGEELMVLKTMRRFAEHRAHRHGRGAKRH